MGRDEHFDEIALFDGFFLATLIYFVAGRVGYVIFHIAEVGTLYRSLAILVYPGINVIVGILAAIVFVMMFARAHGMEVWKVMDAMVVALSIALIFGGLGGVLNGSGVNRAVDLWGLVWAIVTFVVVSRVRKNFRFYSWYKGEASSAAEGLAGHVFLLLVGIYFAVAAWIAQSSWHVWKVPGELLVGLAIIFLSVGMIRRRAGKRDLGWWGKLLEYRLNLLQSMRRRRI